MLASPAFAQPLTLLNDIDFGKVEFTGNPLVGHLQMGTNGVVQYGTNFTGNGFGTPGRLQLGGTAGEAVSIGCRESMDAVRLGATITVYPVKISVKTPQSYAAAATCSGLGESTIVHVLTSNAIDNTIYLAGRMDTNNRSATSGVYTTNAAGGSRGVIRVVYH